MTRPAAVPALAAVGLVALACAAPARASLVSGFGRSPLALAHFAGGSPPRLLLAQRIIDREWGLSEDSVYVEKDVPDWRSAGGAMLMSAAIPGAGQAYAEGPAHGVWFAVAEAAGWTARIVLRRSGERAREDAATFAGTPTDSSSTWSFARWAQATAENPADLERLYAADPESYYDLIESDPRFLSGWAGDPQSTRQRFADMREASDRRLRGARFSESILWMNHVVSAVDAFRMAHIHNMRLSPSLGLRVKSGWRHGSPEVMAAIERRF